MFIVNFDSWFYTDENTFETDWDFDILMDCSRCRSSVVRSDSGWRSFADVKPFLPYAASPACHATEVEDKVAPVKRAPEAWEEHPWLLDMWPDLCFGKEAGRSDNDKQRSQAKAASSSADAAEDGTEQNEVDVAAAFDELNARRTLWDAHGDIVCVDFRWKLRGGAWTAAHKGQAFDCFVAECANGLATKFCKQFSLLRSASFSINVYSEAHAQQLAEIWCALHQSWFDI